MRLVTLSDQLIIRLSRSEMLYAFRRKLTISRHSVVKVEWVAQFKTWPKYEFRCPGSYLPGVIMAGSYFSPDGWDFVYAPKPKGWTRPTLTNVLVITTKRWRYRRIILNLPESQAQEIARWQTGH